MLALTILMFIVQLGSENAVAGDHKAKSSPGSIVKTSPKVSKVSKARALAKAKTKNKALHKTSMKKVTVNSKTKIQERSIASLGDPAPLKAEASIITNKNLPIITSDIYLLDRVVSKKGAVSNVKDRKKIGRFITFSNFSSLSGFDGCHWFQQDYSFSKTLVKLEKKRSMEGSCGKSEKMDVLPESPFSVKYLAGEEELTLTSQKTKEKFIYRKNVANID